MQQKAGSEGVVTKHTSLRALPACTAVPPMATEQSVSPGVAHRDSGTLSEETAAQISMSLLHCYYMASSTSQGMAVLPANSHSCGGTEELFETPSSLLRMDPDEKAAQCPDGIATVQKQQVA